MDKESGTRRSGVRLFLAHLSLFIAAFANAADRSPSANLFYPTATGSYADAYALFEQGLRDELKARGGSLNSQPLALDYNSRSLAGSIDASGQSVVVVVGSRLLEQVRATNTKAQIVGALVDDSRAREGVSGFSLWPSPDPLLESLRAVAPGIRRVFVVYNPTRHRTLIDEAARIAQKKGLQVVSLPAENLADATRHYWGIFQYSNPETDALWLLEGEDLVSVESTLPVIIEESWSRRIVVFSNVMEHANRGVLFAAVPDFRQLGKDVADVVVRVSKGEKPGMRTMPNVRRALNTRMANHLGLATSDRVRRAFDIDVGTR